MALAKDVESGATGWNDAEIIAPPGDLWSDEPAWETEELPQA